MLAAGAKEKWTSEAGDLKKPQSCRENDTE